jgi:hypothetical protein
VTPQLEGLHQKSVEKNCLHFRCCPGHVLYVQIQHVPTADRYNTAQNSSSAHENGLQSEQIDLNLDNPSPAIHARTQVGSRSAQKNILQAAVGSSLTAHVFDPVTNCPDHANCLLTDCKSRHSNATTGINKGNPITKTVGCKPLDIPSNSLHHNCMICEYSCAVSTFMFPNR